MKYVVAIVYAAFGFICLFYPEVIKNVNGIVSGLCFGFASVYMNLEK